MRLSSIHFMFLLVAERNKREEQNKKTKKNPQNTDLLLFICVIYLK